MRPGGVVPRRGARAKEQRTLDRTFSAQSDFDLSKGERTCAGERPYILTMLCLFLKMGVAGVPSTARTLTRLRYATLPDLELSPVTVPSGSDGGASPIVPSSSSGASGGVVGAQAMINTPAKVAPQP